MPTRWAAILLGAALVLAACSPPGGPDRPSGPTPVPEPPDVRELPGRGIQVDGRGTTQTDDISP
ncbi:MAG TPA: hypothetical protein VF937_14610, partial [Chloroflexota bacterium]